MIRQESHMQIDVIAKVGIAVLFHVSFSCSDINLKSQWLRASGPIKKQHTMANNNTTDGMLTAILTEDCDDSDDDDDDNEHQRWR